MACSIFLHFTCPKINLTLFRLQNKNYKTLVFKNSLASVMSAEQRRRSQLGQGANVVNREVGPPAPAYSTHRLRLTPNENHRPQSYEGLVQDFSPELYSKMEKHLPPHMLSVPRDAKYLFMKDIVDRYLSSREMRRISELRNYREKIISHYQPLHRELYSVAIEKYFTPRFMKAVNENSETGYRSIMAEPSPGVFTFEIFQPQFCQLLLSEVENIKKWVHDTRIRIMQPNTMVKCGVALNDFGLGSMLDRLMDNIRPVSKLFFSDVGGDTLDSNHGFIAEYGPDIDAHVGFHVDDSEVTLNVCLGDEFSGGNLYFRGIRCDQHVDLNTQSEVNVSVLQVPGAAVLHRGRHRHGAQEIISGYRSNFVLWCRSSIFREMKNHKSESGGWCGPCQAEKKERLRSSIAAARKILETARRYGNSYRMQSAPPMHKCGTNHQHEIQLKVLSRVHHLAINTFSNSIGYDYSYLRFTLMSNGYGRRRRFISRMQSF